LQLTLYILSYFPPVRKVFITIWQWFLFIDQVLHIKFVPKKMFNYACLHMYNEWKVFWKYRLAEDLNIYDLEQSLFVSDSECGNSVDNSVLDFKGWRVVWVMGNFSLVDVRNSVLQIKCTFSEQVLNLISLFINQLHK
jgi:hypothetical protein